jgi:hypothetical protein
MDKVDGIKFHGDYYPCFTPGYYFYDNE